MKLLRRQNLVGNFGKLILINVFDSFKTIFNRYLSQP